MKKTSTPIGLMQSVIATGLLILFSLTGYSQVAINTDNSQANNSAMLDVKSTAKGMLIPRMTTSQRNAISSPAEALTIFNTDENCLEFWNGSAWFNACSGSADAPPFQYLYGGTGTEACYHFSQTSDGGYILGGYSSSSANGDVSGTNNGGWDIWIVKTDSEGTIEWEKLYGGAGTEFLSSIEQTSDGGYIIAAQSTSSASGDISEITNGSYDYWIVKLNASGNLVWENLMGGTGVDYARSAHETSDGGFIVGGISSSSTSGDVTGSSHGSRDYWIIKLTSSGTTSWQYLYGGNLSDECEYLVQTADGGYLLAGSTRSSSNGDVSGASNGDWDFWFLKIDGTGTKLWNQNHGGSAADNCYAVLELSAGGYIACGSSASSSSGDVSGTNNGSTDYWVIEMDATGNLVNENLFGGSGEEIGYGVDVTSDGGYIATGFSASSASGDVTETTNGGYDTWVVKLDNSHNIDWEHLYGGASTEHAQWIVQTTDGGFGVGGFSYSSASGDVTGVNHGPPDYWLIKLDADGNIVW